MQQSVKTEYIFKTQSKRLAQALEIIETDRKMQDFILSLAKIRSCKRRNLILKKANYLGDA